MALGSLLRRYERGRRFWRHVRVGGHGECWLWEGEIDAAGHGVYGDERADAHAYALVLGEAPAGGLAHVCGEPRCVNPEHLEPGGAEGRGGRATRARRRRSPGPRATRRRRRSAPSPGVA